MKQRAIAPFTIVLLAALGLAACSKPGETLQEASTAEGVRPARNLLLICIDTVRADIFFALGESSGDQLNTWLDRALVFPRAKSASSWTVPTIGSVFSGLWPSGHGAGEMPSRPVIDGVLALDDTLYLPTALYDDVPLLAEAAREAGFHTSIISASPWTHELETRVGLNRGFEKSLRIGKNGSRFAPKKMVEALAEREPGEPFLQFMHFMEAHDWHIEPVPRMKERIAAFSPEERALYLGVAPPSACVDEDSILCIRYLNYAAAVARLRVSLARLLISMEKNDFLADTAVVVFSDHGEQFGEHADDPRVAQTFKELPDHFIGHGHSMYQELLHVPLLAWHPGYDGAVVDELVSLVDITPTVSRWLNLDFMPPDAPGIALTDYLNPSEDIRSRVAYASGIANGEQQVSASRGFDKSIWFMVSDEYAYYDLALDPQEIQSSPNDALILQFDGYYLDYMQSRRSETREPVNFSEEQIRQLQAIGYLQGVDSSEEVEDAPGNGTNTVPDERTGENHNEQVQP